MADILIVDDEVGVRELLSEVLQDEGYSVSLAENAAQARDLHFSKRHDLVLLDIWMPDMDGVSLLKEWAAQQKLTAPVIMMSGHATIETAVEATRIGAIDFLEKPIALTKLLQTIESALTRRAKPAVSAAEKSSAYTLQREPETEYEPAPLPLPAAAAPTAEVSRPPLSPRETAQQTLSAIDVDAPLREARDNFERAYLVYHLEKESGSMTRVAERTGLERTHLYRKLKQLGIDKR
ncbi:MAG: response regulator [Betaproteobacteria bacterium]|nr:response regulator [Betaproteobacteria bacterium]